MYDVVFLDQAQRSQTLAAGLGRDTAVALARVQARQRRVGRMFLTGSERLSDGGLVAIVESARKAA